MTKTKNKNSRAHSQQGTSLHQHSWILALIIIFIIVAIVTVIILIVKPKPIPGPVNPKPDETTTVVPEAPQTPTEDAKPSENPEDKTPQYEGEDPNALEELTGVIVSKSVDDGVLTITATINQYLREIGLCVLTLKGKNHGSMYTASSDALADVTTSYCESFNVPVSEIGSDDYTIEIKVTADGKTGTIIDEVSL